VSAVANSGAPALATLGQQGLIWWRSRTPRERQALAVVAAVLIGFVVWSVLVEPALRTARESPAELDQLDAQYQQMQRVAAEAVALRGAPRVSASDAAAALRAATDRLGEHGKLVLQGDRATLTLAGVSPQELRAWLLEARSGARARTVNAQLQRGAQGYSGTLGLALGGAS
jgi:general secretion pathway protein M